MSQDPNFPQPPTSFTPPGFFRHAVRAGWLMVAIGIFSLIGGGCFAACGLFLPTAQLPADQKANLQQLESQFHGSFTTVFVTMGCAVILFGVYHIIAGFFVRRGKRRAIYTAIVTSFLAIGWCVVNTLGGLLVGAANAAAGVCLMVVIGAIFAWLLMWLFQALRGNASIAAVAQYQAQYWKMLQQQQAYGQPLGVGPPPPPMGAPTGPTSPPGPPLPPSPDPLGWAYGPQSPPPPRV